MAATNSNKLGNNGGRVYSFLNRPVMIDCNFVVDATNGLGVTSLKGSGVQNVFMHTSTTPSAGANNYLNPNPASGYALVQLQNNYAKYAGGFSGAVVPLTGADLAINAAALTVGNPYVITSVGAGSAGTVTVSPVADVAGSLASKYFVLYDAYGNTFVIWFKVSGVGTAPSVSGTLVQQSISSGDSAATIGAALVVTLNALPAAQPGNAAAPAGVFSFTASGTTTVTIVSTKAEPLPGGPADGAAPLNTGFTMAVTKSKSNLQNWQNVGVPKGVVPAVGVSFIATATGDTSGGTSSGLVKAPGSSNIVSVEVVGNASLSLSPIPMGGSPNVGGWVMVKFNGGSFAGSALASHTHDLIVIGGQAAATTNDIAAYAGPLLGKEEAANATFLGANSATNGGVVAASAGSPAGAVSLAAAAPAAGSVIMLSFMVEASSTIIAGE